MWDWNNVYGIGESYHYDFIQLIPVESLVVVKMASNCQIVPLAPGKNSDIDSDFSMFTIQLSTIALQFNPLPTYSTIVGVNSD